MSRNCHSQLQHPTQYQFAGLGSRESMTCKAQLCPDDLATSKLAGSLTVRYMLEDDMLLRPC